MKNMFPERLKTLRQEKNMLQSDVAKVLNTTTRRISHLETGNAEPDIATLWELSEFFGVTVDFLIGKTDY